MSGELEPTTGDVVKSKSDLRVAVLRQEFVEELVPTRTLKEEMMAVFEEENAIMQELKDVEAELANMGDDGDQNRMREILDRMQELQNKAEEKDIDLKLVANSGLPLVEADHRAIRQMILNLVSNAIKFTDEGGEVRVTVDQKDTELRIAVRDNGIGIPADALPRLGEPFEQVSDTRDRNFDGTGLGLALTKSFAEMHGGRLTIASEEGRGTQVSFFLPVPNYQSQSASSVA